MNETKVTIQRYNGETWEPVQVTEARICQIFGLDLSDPETKAYWDEAGRVIEQFQQTQKIMVETWKHMQPALIRVVETIRPFSAATPGYSSRKIKPRSKRGISVQEKRKALGLNVWGKYSEGAYASLSRKDAYTRAMQTERVLLLCQVCNKEFSKRVRIVLLDYWYRLEETITCPNCGTQHEAGKQLWWRWEEGQ